jgi:hypothetical protein
MPGLLPDSSVARGFVDTGELGGRNAKGTPDNRAILMGPEELAERSQFRGSPILSVG